MANIKKESQATRFYYAGNEKIPLLEATDIKAVRLEGTPERPARLSAMAANVMRSDGGEDIGFFGITIFRAPTTTTPTGAAAATARAPLSNVEQTFPVFRTTEAGPEAALILTPQLIVQFKPNISETECAKLINDFKLEVVSKNDLTKNNYLCKVRGGSPEEALTIANELHVKEQVEYAQPDFVRLMPEVNSGTGSVTAAGTGTTPFGGGAGAAFGTAMAPAVSPAKTAEARPAPMVPDPFFANQWGLNKIKAPEAWAITRGNPGIKVAVIDEGVDISHEDLGPNLLTGYDATDNDNNQQPNPRDGHGTACAGIVAALADNGRGVAGVAPNCKIIPVRIAFGAPGGGWVTSDSAIARGIRTAVDRGADVLSNSWGGPFPSSAIQSAFIYARTNGRGGKGCFSPCASGNNDTASIIYPARFPQCFAVGASNEFDQRKSRTSADGENWWGSQYGPELQVVAPGVHIYTTDIMGGGGYNTSGHYVSNFNGTSSATPHVAGVGALVLSVDPNLTVQEVEEIIRRTCDDLAATGRDNETGFGRINAARAVQAASRVWYNVGVAVQFLGTGRECFMRLNLRIYNSGINRVRLNNVVLRSFTPDWATELDRIEFTPNPGGIMEPFTGQDVKLNNILLKANGNQSAWSYRWGLSYSYTFWRPTLPATPLELGTTGQARPRAFTEQFGEVTLTETTSLRFEGQGRGFLQQFTPGFGNNLTGFGNNLTGFGSTGFTGTGSTGYGSNSNTGFGSNPVNPTTGALTLPVTFASFGEMNETELTFNQQGGEFITNAGDTGIVIEKTGGTVRIKI
jgi:thermitase